MRCLPYRKNILTASGVRRCHKNIQKSWPFAASFFHYDLGVKTLITDCFVLRTSTILPRIRNHKIKNNEIFQQRRHV